MTLDGAGCYLYGVGRAPAVPLPETLSGVNGAPVRQLTCGDLTAVISDLPTLQVRATKSDLLAHADVLQTVQAHHDVVPVSFGAVFESADDLVARFLQPQQRSLRRLVDRLAGKCEMQVDATYDEALITRDLVAADRQLQRLRAAGVGYGRQLELGRRFAEKLDAQRARDVRLLQRRLSRLVHSCVAEAPRSMWGVARLAFLLDRRRVAEFERAVDEVSAQTGPRMTLTWTGPLPPYRFVPVGAVSGRG
jgi:hypothetical protein